MGAWGNGNLENDGAQDLLCEISDELFSRVQELLQHPAGHEYDGLEYDELFVRIEMILALHDRGMIATSIEQKDLGTLFEPYLQRWDEYCGDDPPLERRDVMESTFNQLISVVREVHDHDVELVEVPFDPEDEKHRMVQELFERVERRGRSDTDEEN